MQAERITTRPLLPTSQSLRAPSPPARRRRWGGVPDVEARGGAQPERAGSWVGCSAQRWYPTLIGTTSSPRERQEDVLGRKGRLGGPGSAPTSPPLQEQLRTRPRGGVDRCGAVARAATHDEVEGVLLLGSTASGDLTVASDFDVMVVLATGGKAVKAFRSRSP